jgi:NAD(P)-dependent dehydrogenase (short-subunit alcohol dehydrogenase family)
MLDNQVALVTGGGSGIGRGISLRLAREGAAVAVVDAVADRAEETVGLIEDAGGRAVAVNANVAGLSEMEAAVARATDTFGGLDIAVANAGVFRVGTVLDIPPEEFQAQLDINVTGVFYTVRAAAHAMVAAGRGGRIVCISSEAALATGARVWGYSATKAAVKMMVRGWAQELGAHGINVNAIGPGLIDTPLARFQAGREGGELRAIADRQRPVGRVGTPADIAGVVAFLCGPDAAYMSGSFLLVDGGSRDAQTGPVLPDGARQERRALQAEAAERHEILRAALDDA